MKSVAIKIAIGVIAAYAVYKVVTMYGQKLAAPTLGGYDFGTDGGGW